LDCPNDVGIYLNKAADTLIHNNLVLNTRGIDVRFPETDAMIANNVIDGRILRRDGGSFTAERNVTSGLGAALLRKLGDDFLANTGAGNLHLEDPGPILGRGGTFPMPAAIFAIRPLPEERWILDRYNMAVTRPPRQSSLPWTKCLRTESKVRRSPCSR
jgi:hypothetical protein